MGASETTKIPNFGPYRSKSGETTNRVFQYFMVGSLGALSAMGAKATVEGGFLLKDGMGTARGKGGEGRERREQWLIWCLYRFFGQHVCVCGCVGASEGRD